MMRSPMAPNQQLPQAFDTSFRTVNFRLQSSAFVFSVHLPSAVFRFNLQRQFQFFSKRVSATGFQQVLFTIRTNSIPEISATMEPLPC